MGRGVLEVKLLEAKYEAKLEFPRGGRVQNKKTSLGGVSIFSGIAHRLIMFKYGHQMNRPFKL